MIDRALIGDNVRRIAIVRALHLGDLLLAVPAWRLLRQCFPSAEITLIGLAWAKDFVPRFTYIDRVVEFPGYPGMLEVPVDERRLADFLAASRGYDYDLALQMHGSGETSAAFTAALGATFTAGYEPASNGAPQHLDYALPYPTDLVEIARNLRLVEWLSGRTGEPRLEFPVLPADEREVVEIGELAFLPAGRTLIGLHPGARPPARRWPAERFAALGDALSKRYDATIVVLGGLSEQGIASEVVRRMEMAAIDVSGRTTIGGLAALLRRLRLFIGNDSGPSHVAVALDVPSVTIFGPADPARWAPLDRQRHRIIYKKVECSPCGYWECPIDHRCLRRVTVQEVLAVADELMAEARAI